jgi:hypothetical protein
MTDAELQVFLGIAGKKGCAEIMASITPEQRAVYDRMADVEREIELWQAGLGPKPEGVIVCRGHSRGEHP